MDILNGCMAFSIIQTDAPLGWTHTSTRDCPLSLVGVASVPTADRIQWDISYDPLVAGYRIRKSVRSNPRPSINMLYTTHWCWGFVVLYCTQHKQSTVQLVLFAVVNLCGLNFCVLVKNNLLNALQIFYSYNYFLRLFSSTKIKSTQTKAAVQ